MKEVSRIDYGERKRIEQGLDAHDRLADISYGTCRDPTVVSRETRRNRIWLGPVAKSRLAVVRCGNFANCEVTGLCGSWCKVKCKSCGDVECHTVCEEFAKPGCTQTSHYPHVCNGCKLLNRCPEDRWACKAREAQKMALERPGESRRGIDIDSAGLERLSKTVAPLLKKGQSVPVILANHPEPRMCPATLCNYISMGLIAGVPDVTLPRKVRSEKRRRKRDEGERRQRRDLTGRDYEAFPRLSDEVRDVCKEMDTVIGRVGGKCLLTFCWRGHELFYARLLPSKEADSVRDALDDIEMMMSDGHVVGELGIMVVLTDRGSEFDRFEDLERSCHAPGEDEGRMEACYCDPYCSWQKPHTGNAHTLPGRILPKGTSFDDLTQDDVDLIRGHTDSYPRDELDWKTPFEMLPEWGQENVPKAFGSGIIPRDDVNLTPQLLKK